MKVSCDRQHLADCLAFVGPITNSRSPKAHHSCIHINADNGQLKLSSTDGETWASHATSRVEILTPGEALIPAERFIKLVQECKDNTLKLERQGENILVITRHGRFSLHSVPTEDFQTPISLGEGDTFELSAETLSRLVSNTIFATARDNSRYAIAGLLIERDGRKLSVVATDGHRLALAKGNCLSANEQSSSAIVPTRTLQIMTKAGDDPESAVTVCVHGGKIQLSCGDASLTSSLIEGNFPPYRDVLPKDSDRSAIIDRQALLPAIRQANLLTTEDSRGVRMQFDESGLVVSSHSPEAGDAEIKVDLVSWKGEPLTIGFNPNFLLDALKIVQEDEIQLDLKGPNKPGLMHCGEDFQYVVMPAPLQ